MKDLDWKHTFPNVPDSFHHKVNATLMHLPERKEQVEMRGVKKEFTWKKSVVIAAAAVMLVGTTVFASGVVSTFYSSSSAEPSYKEMPSAKQVKADMGLEPKLIETFENGFTFEEAHLVDTNMADDAGNDLGAFKDLEMNYVNGDQTISLWIHDQAVETEFSEETAGDITSYENVDFDYSSYVNKMVPADYELTEEDKAAEEAGDLVFSYGASEVEVITVQSLQWNEDGVNYLLQTFDDNLTQDDMINMAKELVDAQ